MTVIFENFTDIVGKAVGGYVKIRSVDIRPGVKRSGMVTSHTIVVDLVDGHFRSPELDPGPTVITLRAGYVRKSWTLNIPLEGEHELWPLVVASTEYTPEVVGQAQSAASAAAESASAAEASARSTSADRGFVATARTEVERVVSDGAAAVRALLEDDIAATGEARDATEAARDGAVAAAGRAESAAGEAEDSAGSAGESSTLAADAAAVAVAASVATVTYTGNGSPEGKVTAPPGAVYVDRVAATGAVRWVKYSGAGATGWRVSDGDTGDRHIQELISAGLVADVTRLRRIGSTVTLYIQARLEDWPTPAMMLRLPEGFRATGSLYLPQPYAQAGGIVTTGSSGVFTLHSTRNPNSAAPTYRWAWTWPTNDPWPTALPGVPV